MRQSRVRLGLAAACLSTVGKFAFATYTWKPMEDSLTDGLNPKTGKAWDIPDWQEGKLPGRDRALNGDVES